MTRFSLWTKTLSSAERSIASDIFKSRPRASRSYNDRLRENTQAECEYSLTLICYQSVLEYQQNGVYKRHDALTISSRFKRRPTTTTTTKQQRRKGSQSYINPDNHPSSKQQRKNPPEMSTRQFIKLIPGNPPWNCNPTPTPPKSVRKSIQVTVRKSSPQNNSPHPTPRRPQISPKRK